MMYKFVYWCWRPDSLILSYFQIPRILLCSLTCCFLPLLGVRRCQPKTQATLANFVSHTTISIVIQLAAFGGVFLCECRQSLFQIRIVGAGLN